MKRRGVIFDVGHGQGSFDWRVAEEAASARGFWPDLISTDLHSGNVDGAAKDLTHVMSKFLALGMPFYEVQSMYRQLKYTWAFFRFSLQFFILFKFINK